MEKLDLHCLSYLSALAFFDVLLSLVLLFKD